MMETTASANDERLSRVIGGWTGYEHNIQRCRMYKM